MPSQYGLFSCDCETLPIVDGKLHYYRNWLSEEEADKLLLVLQHKVLWQQTEITVYGKSVPIPRLNAWYGDPGCRYTYSNAELEPIPWLPELMVINQRLSASLGCCFNTVLVNYYRNGNDSVAWHSDDEVELGSNPVIASVSLGAERRFCMRHRYCDKTQKTIDLHHGSLLLMSGRMQHYWQHQIPKIPKLVNSRINLTFRRVCT
jgi:alkylated DNA repair dioxygenase AlkB